MRIDSIIWPEERIAHIAWHAVTPEEVERPMKQSKLPRTDSIQESAEFWDTHDLTDANARDAATALKQSRARLKRLVSACKTPG